MQGLTVYQRYDILPFAQLPFWVTAVIGEKEDILLNSRQAAEILNLSPDTVNELARKQTLPGLKRGRQWRFRRRDVTFLKRQMQDQVAA